MHRVLILGAASLALVGLGIPRYQGLRQRLHRLEERESARPARDRALRRELGDLSGDLAGLRARLAAAERGEAAGRAALEDELTELEQRLFLTSGQLAELDQRRGSERADIRTRLAALESGVETRWDGLRRAVDAASVLANETRHELDGMVEPSERDRWREMVAPSVQLAGEATVGSGVLLPSRERADGVGHDTLLLTAWHVVRDIRADSLQQDPPIPVTIYREDRSLRHERATLVVFEPALDVALLLLDTNTPVAHGARLATRSELGEACIFRPVIAVGCPLGNDPIPTRGEVSDTEHVVDGSTYWMISAPTYIGNSGGGIFDARTRRLSGIFSKIYTHGSLRPTVVPHMGLGTPLDRVYDWLDTRDEVELIEGPDGVELRLAAADQGTCLPE